MREKLTPQKKPSNDTKKKPISKQDNPKPKILKYKPTKGDQSKQWVVQAILNERITLVPVTEASAEKNKLSEQKQKSEPQTNIFKNYHKVKEYQIAWAQNRKQGLWPNTWEPQQNIPEETRLDYLLKKRNKINDKKNKRSSNLKTKSLRTHIKFTMNKQSISRRAITLEQRRNQSQKTIRRILSNKFLGKNIKSHDYKNWFYSFSSKIDQFETMINRFLKQQKNTKPKKNQVAIARSQKVKNLKEQFIELVESAKEENIDVVSQLLQRPEKSSIKTQNARYDEKKTEQAPKKACLKLVKDICYLGQANNVNHFIIKCHDGSLKFIRQDDLIKYLPWIYEKLIIRTIENQLQDCAQKVASMKVDNYFLAGRHLEELSYEFGFPRNYFWQLQKEQNKRKNRFFNSQVNQLSKSQNEFSQFNDLNLSSEKQKSQVNPSRDKQFNEINNQLEHMRIENINQVQKCFNSFSLKLPEDDNFLNQSSFILGQVNKKISDDLKLRSCKYLFSSNSKLIDEWQNTKLSLRSQKLLNTTKEKRQSSLNFENCFEIKQTKQSKSVKQENLDKKSTSTLLKIQTHESLGIAKNKGELPYKKTPQKRSNLNQHQKKPQKKAKLTQEEQINKILGQIQEIPTHKRKYDFYDSEDEQSKN